MNDLKKLDDASLLSQLEALVAKEREVSTAILKHLQEVQRRRLFSDLGYPSLFAYCVQCLGYSESAAQRRIEAARLLNQLPELETKIETGKDAQLMDDLEKLKGLLAHSHPNMSWADLIRYMATQTLKKLLPKRNARAQKSRAHLPQLQPKKGDQNYGDSEDGSLSPRVQPLRVADVGFVREEHY